ncbi:MAG: ABC transporter permease [Bacteroidota bacterium]|nr:ABC transporter permease [Bacteroidota bacterium]
MFSGNLKIAWRNLVRNKTSALINVLGLSVGLAFSLLILLWVQNELGVDGFHQNGKQLYAVYERQYTDNQIQGVYYTPALLAEQLKKIPDVQYAANAMFDFKNAFSVGGRSLTFNGGAAGKDYFKMFSFPLVQGSAQTVLGSPSGIAISQKMAKAFFGSAESAIGNTLRYENTRDFKITGVFENVPDNATQNFDFIINWDAFLQIAPFLKSWGISAPLCYVMLRGDADAARVENKFTHFLDDLVPYQKKGSYTLELGLQQFGQVYLHNHFTDGRIDGGRIEYVKLFTIVAVFILLIACINFMNLTTARSIKRAREIGVRKVMGALRPALIKQFIGESLLLTSFSAAIALALVVAFLPLFNEFTQKNIGLPFFQFAFWPKFIIIILITGLVSGSYPALFLSSFNPARVFKGTVRLAGGALSFRKGLVVFQFVLSVILIISTMIVSRQISYIQAKNLGFDHENLVYMPLKGDAGKQYDVFKSEALHMPGIESVSRVIENPNDIITNTIGVNWEGKDPNLHIQFAFIALGYDFVHTMRLRLLEGRDYSRSYAGDSSGYLINEAALQKIGFKNPIGKPLIMWGKTGTIVGVLKDFHFTSFHEPIKPLIVRFGEHEQPATALVRTQPGKTKEALTSLNILWNQMNPKFPFEYTFSDEEFRKMYRNEQIVGNLAHVFAFLAVFISCLGLLGLAMFTAEQRVKEIGVRKVLGASVASLFTLLASEFLGLVVIALLIASPLAWYAMNKWLENYAYHTQMEWWIFLTAGFAALLISFVTVSFQAARTALINPVQSLRSE